MGSPAFHLSFQSGKQGLAHALAPESRSGHDAGEVCAARLSQGKGLRGHAVDEAHHLAFNLRDQQVFRLAPVAAQEFPFKVFLGQGIIQHFPRVHAGVPKVQHRLFVRGTEGPDDHFAHTLSFLSRPPQKYAARASYCQAQIIHTLRSVLLWKDSASLYTRGGVLGRTFEKKRECKKNRRAGDMGWG